MYFDPILLAEQREILLSIQATLAAAMNTCDKMQASCDKIREICSKPFFESAQSSTNSIAVDTSSEVLDEYRDDSSVKEEDHISVSYPALGAQSVSINEDSKTSLAIPVFVRNLSGDNEDCLLQEELRSSESKRILQGTEFSKLYCLIALEWDDKGISHTHQVFEEMPQRSLCKYYNVFGSDLKFDTWCFDPGILWCFSVNRLVQFAQKEDNMSFGPGIGSTTVASIFQSKFNTLPRSALLISLAELLDTIKVFSVSSMAVCLLLDMVQTRVQGRNYPCTIVADGMQNMISEVKFPLFIPIYKDIFWCDESLIAAQSSIAWVVLLHIAWVYASEVLPSINNISFSDARCYTANARAVCASQPPSCITAGIEIVTRKPYFSRKDLDSLKYCGHLFVSSCYSICVAALPRCFRRKVMQEYDYKGADKRLLVAVGMLKYQEEQSSGSPPDPGISLGIISEVDHSFSTRWDSTGLMCYVCSSDMCSSGEFIGCSSLTACAVIICETVTLQGHIAGYFQQHILAAPHIEGIVQLIHYIFQLHWVLYVSTIGPMLFQFGIYRGVTSVFSDITISSASVEELISQRFASTACRSQLALGAFLRVLQFQLRSRLFGVSSMVQLLETPMQISDIQLYILQFFVKVHSLLSICFGTSYTKKCASVTSGGLSMYLAQYDCVVISLADQFQQAKSTLYDARDSYFFISSTILISLLLSAILRTGWFVFIFPAEPNNNGVACRSDLRGSIVIVVKHRLTRVAKPKMLSGVSLEGLHVLTLTCCFVDLQFLCADGGPRIVSFQPSELFSLEQIAAWTGMIAKTLQTVHWSYYSGLSSARKVFCCLLYVSMPLQQDFIQGVIEYIRGVEAEVVHFTYVWESKQQNPGTIQQPVFHLFDVTQMPFLQSFRILKQEWIHFYVSKALYNAAQVCNQGGSVVWAEFSIFGLTYDFKDFPHAPSTLITANNYVGSIWLSPTDTLFGCMIATLCTPVIQHYGWSIALFTQVSNSGRHWQQKGRPVLSSGKFNIVETKVFNAHSQPVQQWPHILNRCLLASQSLKIGILTSSYVLVLLQASRLKMGSFLLQYKPATLVQLCIFCDDPVLVCMILRTFPTCVILPDTILWHIVCSSTAFDNSLLIRYLSGKNVWATIDSLYNLNGHLPMTPTQEGGYLFTTPATPICKVSSTDCERTFQVGDHVYLILQSYKQSSVVVRNNLKLSYGPYCILERVGKKVGLSDKVLSRLSSFTDSGECPLQSMTIFAQRLSHNHHRAVGSEVLVQWAATIDSDTTWEAAQHIQHIQT